MWKIQLTYFKASGKYYSAGEYETDLDPRKGDFHIMSEIKDMFLRGNYPGLVSGSHREFHVLVQIPFHDGSDNLMPHLIPIGSH